MDEIQDRIDDVEDKLKKMDTDMESLTKISQLEKDLKAGEE